MLIGISELDGGCVEPINYKLGTVITHKLYAYRGVIVSCDPYCMAGETWYKSNKTQPAKQQPWYHVLVHESGGLSTYVAQSNLLIDKTKEPIIHPRIEVYFSAFQSGAYILREKKNS